MFVFFHRSDLIVILFLNIGLLSGYAQTTYTFNGTGGWSVPSLWDVYPGTTINDGDLVVIEGQCYGEAVEPITNYGTIIINESGRLDLHNETMTNINAENINNGSLNNNGELLLLDNSIIENHGNFRNYRILNVSADSELINTRNLSGSAALGSNPSYTVHTEDFNNDGFLIPGGNIIGRYNLYGDYTCNDDAKLAIQLEYANRYDQLVVSGSAYITGRLKVRVIGCCYTPESGDTFTIVTADAVTGTFTSFDLPSTHTWNITYTDTEVILEVIAFLNTPDFEMEQVVVYPNPTSDFLNIELGSESELKKVNIYNQLGQLINQGSDTKINVSNYSKGIYFAKIETYKGEVTKRFIIK